MTRLQDLHSEHDQSPWLDNLTRDYLADGTLQELIAAGIRGVTANPSTFAKAIAGSDAYDHQLRSLLATGGTIEDAYWQLVSDDVSDALEVFRPLYEESRGSDGFVSLEIAPGLAGDTNATIAAARGFHQRIDRANLMVKIPATDAGIPAIRAMTAEGRNINITLIFSLARYEQVIEAYMAGLEEFVETGGDASLVHSVASFFVSRVDTEVDRRLQAIGTPLALSLQGQAAVSQARLAYQLFRTRFASDRWLRLRAAGARTQRPLWASTSTKNPAYRDTMYVEDLIGADTVTTITETTIDAIEDHGVLDRTLDQGTDRAAEVLRQLAELGVDIDDVANTLERQGIDRFVADQRTAIEALRQKSSAVTTG